MTTIRQLITEAMRLNRVVAANEVPTDSDMQVGKEALVSMIDSMQADLLNIYTTSPRRFLLEAGVQDYTLGPALDSAGNLTGADWVLDRPVRVERAVILQNPSVVFATAPNEVAFSLNGSAGQVVLRSADSQMQYFTDFSGDNRALSVTASDWDLANLPTDAVVDADTFTVPGDTWTVRSATFFGLPPSLVDIIFAEVYYGANIPSDTWFGVVTNGVDAPSTPAPAVLPFDANSLAGGQYYALFNPTTGEWINSDGNSGQNDGLILQAGDVIGLSFDTYGPGTPVLSPDIVIWVNGTQRFTIEVPYACYDATDGRGEIAVAITKGTF